MTQWAIIIIIWSGLWGGIDTDISSVRFATRDHCLQAVELIRAKSKQLHAVCIEVAK